MGLATNGEPLNLSEGYNTSSSLSKYQHGLKFGSVGVVGPRKNGVGFIRRISN